MIRRMSMLLIVQLTVTVVFCQISGRVVDTSGTPISGATIFLEKAKDSLPERSAITDTEGRFAINNIIPGVYVVTISSKGYDGFRSDSFSIVRAKQLYDLGEIKMKTSPGSLQEIVVRANKPLMQQKPEGLILQVENSILTKGSSILQVLEKSPGVLINPRDNGISLNGKTGVLVMLDGKQLRMSEDQLLVLLSGMSADNISSIELLSTPGAKYDADGSGGIINITTKKQIRKGTHANISLTAGYGYRPKAVAGINLSHINAKINIWGAYTYSHNSTYTDMFITGTQSMPIFGGDAATVFSDTTYVKSVNQNAVAGAELKLSSKTTLGLNLNYSINSYKRDNSGDAYFTILPDSVLNFKGNNQGNNTWNNLIGSLSIEQILQKGEKLKADFDYLFYRNVNPYSVQSSFRNMSGEQVSNDNELFAPKQLGFANTGIHVMSAKIDYEKVINTKLTLEAGFKSNFTKSNSYSGFESLVNGNWTTNPNTINNIDMKESISAAYINIHSNLNERTSLNAGLRYEYSHTNMLNRLNDSVIVNRKLSSIFPDLFLTRKINANSEFQLSYTKRISRPTYNDLASYVGYSDPTAAYTGNPFLQPAITHNIKLGYKIKSVVFSLLFSRDKNAIARYQLTESPDREILFISPQNIAKQHFITLQANLPVKVNDWWTMAYGFVGGYRQYEVNYTKDRFSKSYFGYSTNFSWVFKMPYDFTAELSGNYNNNSYNGTVSMKGFATINAGIKKELGRHRGMLQLSVSDIFSDQIYNVRFGTVTTEAFNIKSDVTVQTESAKFPIFRVSYSVPFGNSNAKREGKASAKEEQERVMK